MTGQTPRHTTIQCHSNIQTIRLGKVFFASWAIHMKRQPMFG
jgi:hypothetical protein